MEQFNSVVAQYYPNATSEALFVANGLQQLDQLGFGRKNTIVHILACRDHLTHTLHARLSEAWGSATHHATVGGCVLASTVNHLVESAATVDNPSYLFIVLGHIGFDSAANCTDLHTIQREYARMRTRWIEQLEVDDELADLRQQLAPHLQELNPSLIEMTFSAHNATCDALQHQINDGELANTNYAVLSGIQLNGNDDRSLIWPGLGYAVVDGQRHALELDLEFA